MTQEDAESGLGSIVSNDRASLYQVTVIGDDFTISWGTKKEVCDGR